MTELLHYHREDHLRELELNRLEFVLEFNSAETQTAYLVSEDVIKEFYSTPLQKCDQWRVKIYRAICHCQLITGRRTL